MIQVALETYYVDNGSFPKNTDGCLPEENALAQYMGNRLPVDTLGHINDGCTTPGKFAYHSFIGKSDAPQVAIGATLETNNGNSIKPINEYTDEELKDFSGRIGAGKYYIDIR